MSAFDDETKILISFVVPDDPKALRRALVAKHGKHASMRDHPDNREPRAKIRLLADIAMGGLPPVTGVVGVLLRAYGIRPKRIIWKKKPNYPRPMMRTPDLVNIRKLIEDAMEGPVYRNDLQICFIDDEKWYVAGPANDAYTPPPHLQKPHVRVVVYTYPEWDL